MDPERDRTVRMLTADVVDTLGEIHRHVVDREIPIVLELTDSADGFAEKLVDDVQQVILDCFIHTTWPACPRHPKHPLWFRDGAWWCEQDGVRVAALGELHALDNHSVGGGELTVHVLSTERLELRWLTAEDAEFIIALTNDPDWLRYIGDRGIRTLDDARGYIAKGPASLYATLGFGLYAVDERASGTTTGICGLIRRDWLETVDIGFAFLPSFRGMGYAYEAAAATMEHAQALGFDRVLAIVSPDNADSIRLLTKLGMTFERTATEPGDDDGEVSVYGRSVAPG